MAWRILSAAEIKRTSNSLCTRSESESQKFSPDKASIPPPKRLESAKSYAARGLLSGYTSGSNEPRFQIRKKGGADRGMAGRYQGYHNIPDGEGYVSFEVFWQRGGWFWRPMLRLDGQVVGPFTSKRSNPATNCCRTAGGFSPSRPNVGSQFL